MVRNPPRNELPFCCGDDNDDDCKVIDVLIDVATEENVCPNDVHDMEGTFNCALVAPLFWAVCTIWRNTGYWFGFAFVFVPLLLLLLLLLLFESFLPFPSMPPPIPIAVNRNGFAIATCLVVIEWMWSIICWRFFFGSDGTPSDSNNNDVTVLLVLKLLWPRELHSSIICSAIAKLGRKKPCPDGGIVCLWLYIWTNWLYSIHVIGTHRYNTCACSFINIIVTMSEPSIRPVRSCSCKRTAMKSIAIAIQTASNRFRVPHTSLVFILPDVSIIITVWDNTATALAPTWCVVIEGGIGIGCNSTGFV